MDELKIPEEAKARAAFLRTELERNSQLYYQKARPEISDLAFDALLRELQDLEAAHPALVTPDSPTQRVGGAPLEGFQKVAHAVPMMSLDNTYSIGEIRDFAARVCKGLGGQSADFVLEPKVDGVSISLRYEHGVLVRAATRGDGKVGDDVTANARTIRSIPHKIPTTAAVFEVRGEVYMGKTAFANLNAQLVASGEESFSNSRNATAGSIKLLDSREVAARPLSVVFYATGELVGTEFETHAEVLLELARLGFPTVPCWWRCSDIEEVIARTEELQQRESEFEFEMDGAVIKVNRLFFWRQLGSTAKAPRYAMAYKYSHEQAETVLHAITLQVGRTGVLTPVAELKPVELAGSVIARATLHNEDEIRRKDIRVGDTVLIEKAGEVIPAVMAVVLEKRPPSSVAFDLFAHAGGKCPACGKAITRDIEDAAWRCTNPDCPAQVRSRIEHFVSRKAMNIDGLGEAIVAALTTESHTIETVDNGLFGITKEKRHLPPVMHDVGDIYSLTPEAIELRRPNRAENSQSTEMKMATKICAAIEASKNCELWRLLHGLGIPNVGEGLARTLAAEFKCLDVIQEKARQKEFGVVKDMGAIVAQSICEFFANPRQQKIIEKLRRAGVRLDRVDELKPTTSANGLFCGKRVVLTGALSQLTREQAEEKLRQAGALIASAVGKTTNFVVAGADAGKKLEKARDLGIPILSEEEFLKNVENFT